jgi:hypothetical protein
MHRLGEILHLINMILFFFLTPTVKSNGASGLRNLPDHKFNPLFLKQAKEGDPLVMDPNRK